MIHKLEFRVGDVICAIGYPCKLVVVGLPTDDRQYYLTRSLDRWKTSYAVPLNVSVAESEYVLVDGADVPDEDWNSQHDREEEEEEDGLGL